MGYLFLDIETYSAPNNPESSFNPYLPESKVLVISYSYYPGFKPPTREEIKPPVFLKEWEVGEVGILQRFYGELERICQQDSIKHLTIVGYNILKFDLPYLFGRMTHHRIAPEQDLYRALFQTWGLDMFQLSPVINEKVPEVERLWGVGQKAANRFFNLQVKEGTGLDCSRYYDAGQYDLIMKYCTEEFTFEQLLDAMYLHIRDVVMKNQAKNPPH